MSSRYINSQQACPEGLRIVDEQVKKFHDHRQTMKLRETEQVHLMTCTVCNPTLMVEGFMKKVGKNVVLLSEVEHG